MWDAISNILQALGKPEPTSNGACLTNVTNTYKTTTFVGVSGVGVRINN